MLIFNDNIITTIIKYTRGILSISFRIFMIANYIYHESFY